MLEMQETASPSCHEAESLQAALAAGCHGPCSRFCSRRVASRYSPRLPALPVPPLGSRQSLSCYDSSAGSGLNVGSRCCALTRTALAAD
jgi:hypothetical protein